MKTRSELRNIIVNVLYQIYIMDGSDITYDVDAIIKEQLEVENEFVDTSVKEILKNQKKIDKYANKYLKNWTVDRLSKVDHAILSLGIYELLYTDVPPIVAINEAIELSKLYSDLKVVKMINGVLDNVYHNEVPDGR